MTPYENLLRTYRFATPAGGLTLRFGMYPPVRNVDAMCEPMEAHGGIA
ncbi:MAG: hypothetical protein ACOCW3_05065 [Spirochaetota bacterium]